MKKMNRSYSILQLQRLHRDGIWKEKKLRLLSKPGLRLLLPINTSNNRRLMRHITRVAVEAALKS